MYNFKYQLQPLIKSELSSQFQIELEVRDNQNLPVIGKKVELKTVKPSSVKIQWIKSNKEPNLGYINNVINPNSKESCIWNSTYNTKLLLSVDNKIQDFVFTQNKIFVLDTSGNLYEENKKVCTNLKGFKLLVDRKNNFIIASPKKLVQVYPNLSYYQNEINVDSNIKDVCLIDDKIFILQSKKITIYEKNKKIKDVLLNVDFDKIIPYNKNLLLIKGKDCVLFNYNLQKNINGWILPYDNNTNFSISGNKLTFFNENQQIIYDLIKSQYFEENLSFLDFFSDKIIQNKENYYYIFNSELFCTSYDSKPLEIEFFIPYEIDLQSINLDLESNDIVSILVWQQSEWTLVFNDCINEVCSIPINLKTQKIKLVTNNKESFQLNKILDLMISGSTNYGTIENSLQFLNSEGKSYFKYIVRSFEQPENFLAIVHEEISS